MLINFNVKLNLEVDSKGVALIKKQNLMLKSVVMKLSEYLHEARQTAKLGVPFIMNQLLHVSAVTADSIMAGLDGELTLAAVAQGATLWLLAQLMLIGLTISLAPIYARLFARDDLQQLKTIFQQAVWLSILLVPLGIMFVWWAPYLMQVMQVKTIIISPAKNYLFIMMFAVPFFSIYLPVRFFNEGIGNPKVVTIITALSVPINVAGNYILITGLFGLPKMGATGIAISSLVSIIFVAIVGWVYMLTSPRLQAYNLFKNFQYPVKKSIVYFIRIGTPNAVAFLMEAGMFSTVVLLSGRLGVRIAAANQIALSYASTTFMLPLGLSFAIMTRIGMATGLNDKKKIRVVGVSGIAMGAFIMVCSVLNILFFGKNIALLYSQEQAVIEIALGLLQLAAVFQIFDGIQVCATGALRGLEETKAPMYYAILGYWVLAIPLAVLLAFYYHMSARGLWIGLLCGLSVTALLGTRKFLKLAKIS